MAAADKPGVLYVVATPIGNLEDVTLRAIRLLGEVDLVAAEDTRRTRTLLTHLGIRKPLVSYYDAVESRRAPELVERLLSGQSIALVSDAGTPLISDPGHRLVRAAIDAGVAVVPVPGPSSPIALLSCAGMAPDRFTFVGFLPSGASQRRRALGELVGRDETLVFLESPRRLPALLADMAAILGERDAAIGRELTKLHEEVVRGRLGDLAARFAPIARDGTLRGEVVLAVAGSGARAARRERGGAASSTERDGVAPGEQPDPAALDVLLRARLASGEAVSALAREIAAETGLPRRVVYQRALTLRGRPAPR